jgi:hypothetical protein
MKKIVMTQDASGMLQARGVHVAYSKLVLWVRSVKLRSEGTLIFRMVVLYAALLLLSSSVVAQVRGAKISLCNASPASQISYVPLPGHPFSTVLSGKLQL